MDSGKVKIASKILDYWFAIEFLGQDSYEMCTNALDNQRKVKVYKKSLEDKKDNVRKQITSFLDVKEGRSLYEVIRKECEDCRMGTWGNITVYLGKIKRELCIENISQYLKTEDSCRPEKSYDDIAVASFQVTADGKYINHTLSLSTVVWAISKLCNTSEHQLSDCLSERAYQDDIDKIEKIFWGTVSTSDEVTGEKITLRTDMAPMPAFSEESITIEKLIEIYTKLKEQYIDKFFINKSDDVDFVKEIYGISIQFFKDEQAREKYDEDNYLGLRHDYFSDDLKMLKDLSEDGVFNHAKGMCRDLINYINAPYDENNQWKRQDLINVKDSDKLELWLQEVLNIRNAPTGKWPSRYMPALMQQVAINLATAKTTTGIIGEKGNIFSINGPPGTGKTTLLKEIVANNIIEKAKRLAQYEDPDDAFEKNKFLHGEKPNGGYSKFVPYWYSLKDDSINDYSLLVASCNNTAVENITKELPLGRGILNNLKTDDKDSDIIKEKLGEVEALFSVETSSKSEKLYVKKANKEGEYKEIYFTGYVRHLLDTADAWGLVAAPLGKKSNIKSFYYNVLEPMHWDFYTNGQFKENRKDIYVKAQKEFAEQLQKVEELQKELADLSDIALRAKQTEEVNKIDNIHYMRIISMAKEELEDLPELKRELQNSIEHLKEEAELARQTEYGINTEYDTYKKICAENKQSVIDAQQKALSTSASIGFFTRIFNKRKCQDAENLAESYRKQAAEFQIQVEESEKQIIELEAKIKSAKAKQECTEFELKEKEEELQKLFEQESELNIRIKVSEAKITESNGQASAVRKQCEQVMEEFRARSEIHRGLVLDNHFVSDFLSRDEKISTRAQVSNLWATDYYNREREKLIYHALQLTKEFILNSRSCRDNFVTLGQYWGLRMNEDKERVLFHREDRERIAGALYETLFLLVPVISSTFASVRALLRDIKSPGTIGTLIVDEAGQAQPQMAVGALYRAKRAIIVGDPKQVEPVVTDDLELLKRSYKEEIYRYYKDKSLSVQKCADILNPFGTYLPNGTDYPEWVGCPLLVHRRCIAPMYEISNSISYGGIMKQQTLLPREEEQKTFVYEKSQWMNISGTENGKKDHFVKQQGEKVCEILEIAFKNSNVPNLYIISPFKSVVYGIRKYIKDYCYQKRESYINKSTIKEDWLSNNIGTVHTFQGKEAGEVIFLLGCDGSRDAEGAVQWVNSNIVNVAVSRAQYRLYVIGDIRVWENNLFVSEMKAIMDTFALKEIDALQNSDLNEEEKAAGYRNVAKQIPSVLSFPVDEIVNEEGDLEYSIETEGFISNLDKVGFTEKSFSREQLQIFGFSDNDELNKLPNNIKRYIVLGIRLYYLLEPVYKCNNNLDASCCAILFCKALELQLTTNFAGGLKRRFPEYEINVSRKNIKLKNAENNDLMIGTIQYILRKKASELEHLMQISGKSSLDINWWNSFNGKLKLFANNRNKCCHSQWFKWADLDNLIRYEFEQDGSDAQRNPKIGGVFYESAVGKNL